MIVEPNLPACDAEWLRLSVGLSQVVGISLYWKNEAFRTFVVKFTINRQLLL